MNSTKLRVSIIALALAAGAATARTDDDKTQPLKGPKVPERHVPGVENGLGTMQGGDKRDVAREMPIPHQQFMRMLNDALGEKAPENIRLTDEQRSQIEKISQEFTQKQRAFVQSNRAEIDKLVEKYGPEVRQLAERAAAARGGEPRRPGKDSEKGDRGEKGGKPGGGGAGDEMKPGLSDDARAEVVAKLKELQAAAPKAEDARTAIWGILKPEQQAAVQKNVDAFKAQREKEMDERYKEREKKKLEERGTKKDPKAPGAEPGKGRPGADASKAIDPARRAELVGQLPDDLKERFGKMPEMMQNRILGRLSEMTTNEQREEFFANIRERLKNGEGGRKPGNK